MESLYTSHDRKALDQGNLSRASSFFALVVAELSPEGFRPHMKRISQILDCASERARALVWVEFSNLCLPSSTALSEKARRHEITNFFSIMAESLLQNPRGEAQNIEYFRKALLFAFVNNPGLFDEVFSSGVHSAPIDQAGPNFAFGIPSALPMRSTSPIDLKQKGKSFPIVEKPSFDSETLPTLPECINEEFIPHPDTTPFDHTLSATFAQLRCLLFWSDTLDSMAPAYKVAVWRVAKYFNYDFGTDHDLTSFTATITSWAKEPLRHVDSIKLLFSAIGYLKNLGVLSQEFEWPDQAELYPIFHGELTAERERRKLRRKKRRGQPTSADDMQIELRPLKLNDFDDKSPRSPHVDVFSPGHSAFTPIRKRTSEIFSSRSDSDYGSKRRRTSMSEHVVMNASSQPMSHPIPTEIDSIVLPHLDSIAFAFEVEDMPQPFRHSRHSFRAFAGSSSTTAGGDETSDYGGGLDVSARSSFSSARAPTDSSSNSLDREIDEEDVMEVVSALSHLDEAETVA